MKTRLLTALVGCAVIIVCIFFVPLWVLGIVLGFLSAVGAWELLHCTVPQASKRVYGYSIASAFILPILFSLGFEIRWSIWGIFLLFFAYSFEMILSYRKEGKTTFEMVAFSMVGGVILPMMLGYLARMGKDNGQLGPVRMLLPFIIAYTCDGGAYFCGLLFGKHKLAPTLSPKKTIEGAVGGVICSVGCTVLYGVILTKLGYQVDVLSLALFSFVGSMISQLGDLTFSAIKRQYGIKDFGKLFPGHGGMLDRFDSMYYLVPLTEFWMLVYPAIR